MNDQVLNKTEFLAACNFEKNDGRVIVVAQDDSTNQVLMVAYADQQALSNTIDSGQMWYLSRERGLWHKGATSSNTQDVVSLTLDCDRDTVLARVIPNGPACHTGSVTCFSQQPTHIVGDSND